MFGCCAHRGGKRADKNVFVNIFFGGERDLPATPMEKLPASAVETESEKEKLLREKELEKENLLPALARYRAAQEAAQNGSDVAVIELPRLRELHAVLTVTKPFWGLHTRAPSPLHSLSHSRTLREACTVSAAPRRSPLKSPARRVCGSRRGA